MNWQAAVDKAFDAMAKEPLMQRGAQTAGLGPQSGDLTGLLRLGPGHTRFLKCLWNI